METQKLLVTKDPFEYLLEKTTKNYLEFAILHKQYIKRQNSKDELVEKIHELYPSINEFLTLMLNSGVNDENIAEKIEIKRSEITERLERGRETNKRSRR